MSPHRQLARKPLISLCLKCGRKLRQEGGLREDANSFRIGRPLCRLRIAARQQHRELGRLRRSSLAAGLNQAGIASPRGTEWSPMAVSWTLARTGGREDRILRG